MMNFALLVCLAVVPLAASNMIHHHMTPDEVMGVFHTTHENVPDYEIVPVIHTRSRRGAYEPVSLKIPVTDDEVHLYLFPTEGYLASTQTPLWTARSSPSAPNGVQYTQIPNALRSIGIPFHDVKAQAAIVATPERDGRLTLDGFISKDRVIRSLPKRLLDDVMYGEHGLYEPHYTKNATDDGEMVYTYHHVIYNQKLPEGSKYSNYQIPDIPKTVGNKVPEVIFPEILVVVDYNEYVLIGKNLEQAKRYIVSFWNAVDLRYRMLSNPRIRINIAGIIIALDADATPYVEKNRVDEAMLDADRALSGMGSFFYKESRINQDFYDFAMLMTPLDLCNMVFEDICDPSTLGYAYVAGACDRNHTKQSSEAVGLVEDNGGFSGIIPAAHEMGHLIGARHDGHPNHAAECGAYEGFIMTSGLLLDENGFEWSNCSVSAFYKFLSEDRAKCLYNTLRPATAVKRFLPGKLLNADEQCKKLYGTKACNKNEASVCTRLECEVPGGGYCRAIAPAAEGSNCGADMMCLNGKCILEGSLTKKQNGITNSSRKAFMRWQKIRPMLPLLKLRNRF